MSEAGGLPESMLRFEHFEVLTREDGRPFELGRGAMGITYKAMDTSLQCPVALKVINGAFLQSEVARQRFLREARAAAGLRHANVASVFHLGNEGDVWFYTMEFIDGETVEAFMQREGAVPVPLALEIAAQVCRALSAAEKQGLIHRDIKPANLMLVRDGSRDLLVKVIDFGLAKSAAASEDATLTLGGFLGTPHFASPEQLEEKPLDIRSDLYSLGVTLWFMLSGQTPFSGSLAQVMSQHLNAAPPMERLAGLPEPVVQILSRLMAKDPEHRPRTAAEARREILAAKEAVGASPSMPTPNVEGGDYETLDEASDLTVVSDFGMETVMEESKAPVGPEIPVDAQLDSLPLTPPALPKSDSKFPLLAGVGIGGLILVVGGGALFFGMRQPAPVGPPKVVATPQPTPMVLETLTPPPPSPSEALLSEIAGQKDPLLALELVGRGLREFPEVSDFQTRGVEILSALPKHEPPLTDAQLTALKPLMQGFPKNLPSAGWLGKVYLENDPGFAIPWLEAAAEAGDAKSAFELMRCYRDGRGTLKDSNKMVEWLKKASELGDPRAMVFLGMAYNNENVLPGLISRDDFEAFRLFSKAVELGFPDAYGNLGALVYSGVGTKDPPNPAKAVELFRQGADLGSHFSMRLYAKALEDGWEGVKPDSEAAKTWYVRAAKLGNAKALEWCKENNVSLETPEASPNPSPTASPAEESPTGQLGR